MSDRELGQRLQVVFHLLDVALDTANVFVGLETVELGDALDLDFGQADDILLGHFTAQAGFERIEPFVDRLQDTFPRGTLLDIMKDLLLDKYFLQRRHVPVLLQFAQPDIQFGLEQFARMVDTTAKYLPHAHEVRLVVHNHARIRRDRHFAIRKSVQRVDSLVRRLVVAHMDDNLDPVRRIVVDLFDLDLALVIGLDDRLLDRFGRRAERNFGDRKRPLVDFVDPRTHFDRTAAQPVVVTRHIRHAAGREIGIELELLAAQVSYARIEQFIEVMRQDFRRKPHGDTFDALGQQQREFER